MSKAARLRRGGQRPIDAPLTDVQRDERFFKERERQRQINAEKTKELRALRLRKAEAERMLAGGTTPSETSASRTHATK
jgi:hypothetical protein